MSKGAWRHPEAHRRPQRTERFMKWWFREVERMNPDGIPGKDGYFYLPCISKITKTIYHGPKGVRVVKGEGAGL